MTASYEALKNSTHGREPTRCLLLCVSLLDPHLESKFLEFCDHLGLCFLDISTEIGKLSLFIWMGTILMCLDLETLLSISASKCGPSG